MAAKAKQTNQMKGTPEVTASGITPKSQRGKGGSTAGLVKVQNNHEKRGRNWLRLFVSGVLVADMIGWQVAVYTSGWSDTWVINGMWATGVAHVAALAVVNFVNKLE